MIGETLKIIRTFSGMTQKELAPHVGISHNYLSQIESGARDPTHKVLQAYVAYFGIPMSSLLFFAEQLEGEDDSDRNSRVRFGRKIISALSKLEYASR